MLVAADLQRPAAIDQLEIVGEQVGVPVYAERRQRNPVSVCRNAVEQARSNGRDVVILDTAGRLHIDEEMMERGRRDRPGRQPAPDLPRLRRDDRPGRRQLAPRRSTSGWSSTA